MKQSSIRMPMKKSQKCVHCNVPYDFQKAMQATEEAGARIIQCPFCKGKVGTLQN